MSWRSVLSPSIQTSQPPRSTPAPNFYTRNGLWCWFLIFLKRVLSIFTHLEFYQDPSYVSENVLQKHSPLRLYDTVTEALRCGLDEGKPARRSSRSISLNSDNNQAKWRFQLFEDPGQVPDSILRKKVETEEEFEKWGEATSVPMDWQMPMSQTKTTSKQDLPIYTNFRYPFPGRFTNLSTYVSKKQNPTAVYKAKFNLPEQWCEEDYESEHDLVLILHGAGPGVEVFANGVRLGYHTDSMTEHEYLLTPECVPRQAEKSHVITLRIFKYCSGSYLEDQDQWWLTGIHRDVELQFRPKAACIWDIDVRANLAAARVELNCAISLDNTSAELSPYAVRATLFDSPTVSMETVVLPIRIIPRTEAKNNLEKLYLGDDRRRGVSEGSMFVLPKERIEPWTAESPKLYSLIVELIQMGTESEPETVVQVEVIRVGFRDVSQNPEKFGEFQVNGERVVFRGVNRHEFTPHHGKVISEESMVADILQMKRHNFNAVRCSHYPNNQRWYELCDYYGLYVIDEANIECHGFVLGGCISLIQFDDRFRDAFLSRCYAMVLRARNHPSIVCWSLGNESGYGPNHYECSKLIRILDDERPVLYEGGTKKGVPLVLGDGRNSVSDFIFPMYHTPELIASYEQESKQRMAPVVLCEYCHCMGNSGGGLHLYWDLFWRNSVWQGGFIWDWVDQGIAYTIPSTTANSSSSSFQQSHHRDYVPHSHSSSNNLNLGSLHNANSAQNLLVTSPRATTGSLPAERSRAESSSSAAGAATTTGTGISTQLSSQAIKQRRSSAVNLLAPHRDHEYCVSKERLLDISFQGKGWLYGGDFGEFSGKEDAQFCLNGVVFPDRTPKPVLYEAKYLMQPYQFLLEAVEGNQIELTVITRYRPAVPLEFGWTLIGEELPASANVSSSRTVDDKVSGIFPSFDVTKDKQVVRFTLPLPTVTTASSTAAPGGIQTPQSDEQTAPSSIPRSSSFFYLRVYSRVNGQCKWADVGHEVAHEVFDLVQTSEGTFGRAPAPNPIHVLPQSSQAGLDMTANSPKMELIDGTRQLVVHANEYDCRIDMKTGALMSFRGKDGQERLSGPSFLPIFYRARTDNDLGGAETHVKSKLIRWFIGNKFWSYSGRWTELGLNEYDESKKWSSVEVTRQDGKSCQVVRTDDLFRVETSYQFLERGIRTNIKVEWIGGPITSVHSLPRIGTLLEIGSQFSRITYCGRGPWENYPDRKKGSSIGVYTQTADDFHVPYVFPSENGGRSDVKWVVMEDSLAQPNTNGAGLAISYSCLDSPDWGIDDEQTLGEGRRFKRPVGTRGAQLNVSRFRVAQLDKARHQYELTRDLMEWRNQSLKVIVDTAHMGVGGDVSWLPSVHDSFKIKFHDPETHESMVWTYQVDLDIITKSSDDDVDEQKRRTEQLNSIRSSVGADET
jgi:beta-galactosidase/beta-glucuronidase